MRIEPTQLFVSSDLPVRNSDDTDALLMRAVSRLRQYGHIGEILMARKGGEDEPFGGKQRPKEALAGGVEREIRPAAPGAARSARGPG